MLPWPGHGAGQDEALADRDKLQLLLRTMVGMVEPPKTIVRGDGARVSDSGHRQAAAREWLRWCDSKAMVRTGQDASVMMR